MKNAKNLIIWQEIKQKLFCGLKSKITWDFWEKSRAMPCFFQWNSWKLWSLVFNSSCWEYLLFVILRKNLKKWKKHSVLIIFPCHSLNQNSSTSDLSFSQVTSVEKWKLVTFLGLGLRPRPQKTFPQFLFFYFGNLRKTQIRRGKILLQTWHGKKSKQNTISS